MLTHLSIEKVIGREIINSHGNPTVEAEVTFSDSSVGRGTALSGASIGEPEAIGFRDGDKPRFGGKGARRAVESINAVVNEVPHGLSPQNVYAVDVATLVADGTENKSELGANAILVVSITSVKAVAESLGIPSYRFLGSANGNNLLVPMMNILNGGVHATNSVDTQEFMIIPVGVPSFSGGPRWCTEVFRSLQKILKSEGNTTAVGDEGGFAPNLKDDEDAIEHILAAVRDAGYEPDKNFVFAMDATSPEWKSDKGIGFYRQPKSGRDFTSKKLIAHWKNLVKKYPVWSIEDGLDGEDWEGWKEMTKELGGKVRLVGDDLFVTNTKCLRKGIELSCDNSILIKLSQVGSVPETLEAVKMAHKVGYTAITSHRSGETEDTMIADLAVVLSMRQIRTGAPSCSERVAKYNQLLRIESDLGVAARCPDKNAFNR